MREIFLAAMIVSSMLVSLSIGLGQYNGKAIYPPLTVDAPCDAGTKQESENPKGDIRPDSGFEVNYNISGIALLSREKSQTEVLVVNGTRLGIVTLRPEGLEPYRPLKWPSDRKPPLDLEAVSSVPDQRRQFLALSREGRVFHLTVSEEYEVKVLTDFNLPKLSGDENEGLSVQNLNGRMVIVWASRGAGELLSVVSYGLLDLNKQQKVTFLSEEKIAAKYPCPKHLKTRHVSDLKVDEDGVVWASATNDHGDDGPFFSTVYVLGKLRAPDKSKDKLEPEIKLEPDRDRTPLKYFKRKVEAIELMPGPDGGIVLGTDDENKGGWLDLQKLSE